MTRRHQSESARDNGGVEPQHRQAAFSSRVIVWDDSRTHGVVAHYEDLFKAQGITVNGQLRSGADGAESLKQLLGHHLQFQSPALPLINILPLSTYFSAIKLRWMIDNWEGVRRAHEAGDLAFGTVESWIAYVSLEPPRSFIPLAHPSLRG